MTAILFGSISTLADTSEYQREAFNKAFEQHGLDWTWERDDYVEMLKSSGGRDRVAEYARQRGEDVDATAVHQTKSENFQRRIGEVGASARDGVLETVREAKEAGVKLALVTTTSAANIDALLGALAPDLTAADFDLVVDAGNVDETKPDPGAYRFALEELGEQPDRCVAIEDNLDGLQSAVAAGVTCVAFPSQNTASHDFEGAERTIDHVAFDDLQPLMSRS